VDVYRRNAADPNHDTLTAQTAKRGAKSMAVHLREQKDVQIKILVVG
jgi:hypothetical protein